MNTPDSKSFASDNHSGAHPRILEAIAAANHDHAPAYGADEWTRRAEQCFKQVFGPDTAVAFVMSGTGANVLALATLLERPYHAVLCSEYAHIYQDETGAPERVLGAPLRALPARDGKIQLHDLERAIARLGDPHAVQPKVISLTQTTEYGTVYTAQEVRAICDFAHRHGLKVHLDGARIANAAVALGLGLRECTRDLGVDVLSFGGMKNGLLFGEAVVVFDPSLARELPYLRKQITQLDSKMRFISAQYEAYLSEGLWRSNAEHSNRMAALLRARLEAIPEVRITQATQANAIFALVPERAAARIQAEFRVAVWDLQPEAGSTELRFMCSFDTTEADVGRFSDCVARAVRA